MVLICVACSTENRLVHWGKQCTQPIWADKVNCTEDGLDLVGNHLRTQKDLRDECNNLY
jgi:hypothetical protein